MSFTPSDQRLISTPTFAYGSVAPANPQPTTYQTPAYSFSDAEANLIMPFTIGGSHPVIQLNGLTMVAWSTHRDIYPVTRMGNTKIRGFTNGHITAAGSLGFTISGQSPFSEAINAFNVWRNKPNRNSSTVVSQLPPMDLSISFSSSLGISSSVVIQGLRFLDTSTNFGIQSIQLQDSYSFMAQNISNVVLDGVPTQNPIQVAPNIVAADTVPTTTIFTSPTQSLVPTMSDLNFINAGESSRSMQWGTNA